MIFLSASIPVEPKDVKAYPNADIIAIREAVKALALAVVPHTQLVWGGHPSITPLIRYIMETMNLNVQNHVTLYQSAWFEASFPDDNKKFERIVVTPAGKSKKESLEIMRNTMIRDFHYQAAVFIGGMDGVIMEYELFHKWHPDTLALPIASTGGAASFIFDSAPINPDIRLKEDKAYLALFKAILPDFKKKA